MCAKNVIAAGHPLTVEAAQEMLQQGGNAFDAAVAAVFTSMVAEPTLTSAGGGGYLIACPRNQDPVVYDFFVSMPEKCIDSSFEFFAVEIDFGTAKQKFHVGMGSVAVPGNVAGLLQVQEELGTLQLKAVLEPAIRNARQGVELNQQQAYLIRILSPILTYTEQGRAIYTQEGRVVQENSVLAMPEFADFLDCLSYEGIDLFYRGAVADRIVELSGSAGGLIQENDLSSYRVKKRTPITCEFAGYEVFLNPPPAQSGWLIQTTLRILNEARCRQNLPITLKDFVMASDLTSQIRKGQTAISCQIDRDCLERFEEQLPLGRALSSPGRGCTTHVSILDSEGNAASVTTSNGEGSGYLIPETGIMLNNMLGEEDISPGGFHRHSHGKRLPSMMSPTLVLKEKKPVLVTGTSGSNRIRSALTQLLVHHLYRKMDIKSATELPRVHLENNLLDAEPGVHGNDLQKLPAVYQVQRWKSKNLYFGGVNSATPTDGAADSRRGGKSVEFESNL